MNKKGRVMPIESDSRKPISLFYSYSHEDEWFMKRLQRHLTPLKRIGKIAEWHDREIEAGKEWQKEIDHHLSSADIILLLVSASFIASEYCWSVEVTKALEWHERGEARVIPVILSKCLWQNHTPFAKLQATPKNAKPIDEWRSWNSAFHDVVSKIEAVVDELQRNADKAPGPAAVSVQPRAEGEIGGRLLFQKKNMIKIFISYAREDRTKAQQLARVFEDQGWSVWWDTRLEAGDVWDEVIERELTAAHCVVVLWSQQSIRKRWVRDEANEGLRREILIPVLIDDVRPPLGFGLVQAELLVGWSGDRSDPRLGRLLAAISSQINSAEPTAKNRNAVGLSTPPHVFADFAEFRDFNARWCPEMVTLPPGEFLMGSPESEEGRYDREGPQHRVRIGSRFAIGRYPVTFAEYDHFCDLTKRKKPKDQGWGRGRRPVINVSWHDAQVYVEWLAKEAGKPYHLPSEAEWEYACQAGTTTPFSFGKTITPQDANYSESKLAKTIEVGSFAPNPWGLCDMHGNV
jgi:Sulfatase-modifying factor enzyme 1/TIR domain